MNFVTAQPDSWGFPEESLGQSLEDWFGRRQRLRGRREHPSSIGLSRQMLAPAQVATEVSPWNRAPVAMTAGHRPAGLAALWGSCLKAAEPLLNFVRSRSSAVNGRIQWLLLIKERPGATDIWTPDSRQS